MSPKRAAVRMSQRACRRRRRSGPRRRLRLQGAAPAAGAAGDSNAAEGAASEQNGAENAGENADAAPKSAEDIKKLLAAKAAAKKKKDSSSSSAAAAIPRKAREAAAGGKKKQKGPKTWESGGKQVGQKARGSDNKYQGVRSPRRCRATCCLPATLVAWRSLVCTERADMDSSRVRCVSQ